MNEFEIVQNESIGTLAIWSFCLEYYKTVKKEPKLPYLFSILPLVFNNRILNNIFRRQLSTGFFASISEDQTMFLGLNNRIDSLKNTTIKSMMLGIATGLIAFDPETLDVIPLRKSNPFDTGNYENKRIFQGARRLGYWYADLGVDQVYSILRIKI